MSVLETSVRALFALGVAQIAFAPSAFAVSTGRFAGKTLYVAPWSNAKVQADLWRYSDPVGAGYMDEMAAQPQAVWVGDWTVNVRDTVDSAVSAANGKLRTIVVYNIPHRDCGNYSSGGARDAGSYRWFIDQVGAGIRWRQTIVILEPDAVALDHCLTDWQRTERHELLNYAIDTLREGGAAVYLDAGDSDWLTASEMAGRLAASGVHRAAGVSLNVAHTEWTGDEIAYGEALQSILGQHIHYVIDTSRNGDGPTWDSQWCNPTNRATGPHPVLMDQGGLDAYLWVKQPGGSDGNCNGGPNAGVWWPEYARTLIQNSRN
ncbi:MAG: glycoside hydrolase family 6 protein [Myxococcota bacterium]